MQVYKYYVVCGEVRWVGYAATQMQACMLALRAPDIELKQLSAVCYIDERGFRDETLGPFGPAAWHFPTDEVFFYMAQGGCEDGCEGI